MDWFLILRYVHREERKKKNSSKKIFSWMPLHGAIEMKFNWFFRIWCTYVCVCLFVCVHNLKEKREKALTSQQRMYICAAFLFVIFFSFSLSSQFTQLNLTFNYTEYLWSIGFVSGFSIKKKILFSNCFAENGDGKFRIF